MALVGSASVVVGNTSVNSVHSVHIIYYIYTYIFFHFFSVTFKIVFSMNYWRVLCCALVLPGRAHLLGTLNTVMSFTCNLT